MAHEKTQLWSTWTAVKSVRRVGGRTVGARAARAVLLLARMGTDDGGARPETLGQGIVRTVYTFLPSIIVFCIFLYILFAPGPEIKVTAASNHTLRPIEQRISPPAAPAPILEQYVHVTDYRCKPGTGDQLMRYAAPVSAYVKKFEGEVTFEVLRGTDAASDEFKVVEHHPSKNAMRSLHAYGPFAAFKKNLEASSIVQQQSSSSWRTQKEAASPPPPEDDR